MPSLNDSSTVVVALRDSGSIPDIGTSFYSLTNYGKTMTLQEVRHKLRLLDAEIFEHRILKNRDGSPVRARRNGKNKEWKREPDRFQIPVKYGLRDYFTINKQNMNDWRAQ
jgi:hypothetical protein